MKKTKITSPNWIFLVSGSASNARKAGIIRFAPRFAAFVPSFLETVSVCPSCTNHDCTRIHNPEAGVNGCAHFSPLIPNVLTVPFCNLLSFRFRLFDCGHQCTFCFADTVSPAPRHSRCFILSPMIDGLSATLEAGAQQPMTQEHDANKYRNMLQRRYR